MPAPLGHTAVLGRRFGARSRLRGDVPRWCPLRWPTSPWSPVLVIDLQRMELDTSHGEESESYSG